jgi:hypothetical protein
MKRLRSRRTEPARSIDHRSLREVERLSREGNIYIQVVAGLLVAIFAWLHLGDVPFATAVKNIQHHYVQQFGIVFYYFCWLGGSTFDVLIQKRVYALAPASTQQRMDSVLLVSLFFLVTLALLWVKDDFQLFSTALTAFIIVNIAGWSHIANRVRPAIQASKDAYAASQDFIGVEQVNCVASYIGGRWQIHRFVIMLLMLVVLNLIGFVDDVRGWCAGFLATVFPSVSVDVFATLLPSVSFVIFVLVAEAWVWWKRFETWTTVRVLDQVGRRYALNPAGSR